MLIILLFKFDVSLNNLLYSYIDGLLYFLLKLNPPSFISNLLSLLLFSITTPISGLKILKLEPLGKIIFPFAFSYFKNPL